MARFRHFEPPNCYFVPTNSEVKCRCICPESVRRETYPRPLHASVPIFLPSLANLFHDEILRLIHDDLPTFLQRDVRIEVRSWTRQHVDLSYGVLIGGEATSHE